MTDEEMKQKAYMNALQNMSGQPIAQPSPDDVAGRIFTPGQGWKPGPRSTRAEEMPGMQANAVGASVDPYDMLKLKEEQDNLAGRIFTPGQGWKKNPQS
jgi:hypothetical protein